MASARSIRERLSAAALLLLLGGADRRSSEELRYEIVTNGDVNGALTVTIDAGGAIAMRNHYQSQDKVRDLAVTVQLAPDGTPDRIDRTGQSFAFQPIDEHFTRTGGTARWRNRIEDAGSPSARGRYYVALGLTQNGDSAAYETGLLAAAALRARGTGLLLLPAGTIRATIAGRYPAAWAGGAAQLRLVRLDGLGIEPSYIWLDERGRLFANRTTVRSGARALLPELNRLATAADAAVLAAALRREAAGGPEPALLFRDVGVFDAPNARLLPHRDVLVTGGKIAEVAAAGAIAASGARIVDGRGHTLLPGLWDMHVHLSGAREALRHLASGVTTVRDMGNDNAALRALSARIDTGQTPGPTVVKAGFIEGRSSSTTYTGRVVASEAEALQAVTAYADEGYAQIKLYNAVHAAWVPAIARAAHARGLRLSGHVPFDGRAAQVVRDGYDEIQHWVFLILNFSLRPVTTGLTFNTAEVARTLDVAGAQFGGLVDLMKARGTVMDMTLAVYEPLLLGSPGVPGPIFTRVPAHLPPPYLRQVATGPLPTPADMTTAEFRATYGKALAIAKLLHDRGIQLVAGTDFAPMGGLALPRELELMVQAGIAPADVLRIATSDAARVMRQDAHSGAIAPGMDGDLLLVTGDPTRDIADVRHAVLVVKRGVAYQPARLLAASGVPD